nr:phytoene desaturase [Anaerolineae bacterium]
ANADVTTTVNHLLPAGAVPPRRVQRLSNYEPSCSGFVLLLGVEKQFPQLAHHNILFSADYPAEFKAIFKTLIPPDDPTIYVSITAKTDAQHAPPGCENWFILVNAPPLSPRYDWATQASAYRDLVLAKLAARGLDVRAAIRSETMLTPVDLERMSGAWRGALYGPSANKKFTAFVRPHNRSRDVPGLYFAGGTTHPGGGVPMVMLSGKVAAGLIAADLPL